MTKRILLPGDFDMQALSDHLSILSWVTPRLAVSAYATANDPRLLDAEGVEHIISIGQLSPKDPRVRAHFPDIADGEPVPDILIERVVHAMLGCTRDGPTVIHCVAGVSRSAGFAMLYIALSEQISLEDAERRVTRIRKVALVHPAVMASLRSWLDSYLEKTGKNADDQKQTL